MKASSSCLNPTSYQDLSKVLVELRDKINASPLKKIYTYVGEPIYSEETYLFKKMIQDTGIKCDIIEVPDTNFDPDIWDPATSLLHIPGAESSKLDQFLGDKVEKIKDYVSKGGRFIGWCGGGYWACRKVNYRISESETMVKIRNLSLWNGEETGPLLPYLGNPEGNIGFFHGTVELKWSGSEFLRQKITEGITTNVLLSGGGSFIPSKEEHRYEVLGKYVNHKLPNAVVKTYVGKGIAILVNPYFTHGSTYMSSGLAGYQYHFPDHPWEQICSSLKDNKLERQICFADMLLETVLDGGGD